MSDQPPVTGDTPAFERARCAWEVTAGIVPGTVDPEHSRRFVLTSAEWDGGRGLEAFIRWQAAASAYAAYLQVLCADGRSVNWTRVEFVWF